MLPATYEAQNLREGYEISGSLVVDSIGAGSNPAYVWIKFHNGDSGLFNRRDRFEVTHRW
ncbi:hypothetical protein SEA_BRUTONGASTER_168 [Gordonia phage BrutonGaster]|uniref:Uncharacterized protein n=1 Tax=Gordonia phage BrutonGaster TaxID=2530116 RepID=A0A482JKU9_9CAUD|nr:hypothetical protein HOV26_gp014 [Gordonia phage BrutonGaster]QBP33382.1 hypothetical protein SEA_BRUTONGASTER_168 [Gordonia phage BrutonGaster]